MSASITNRVVLTKTQAAAAQVRFLALIAAREAELAAKNRSPDAHEHLIYSALFASAYGAEQVEIVDDPAPARPN